MVWLAAGAEVRRMDFLDINLVRGLVLLLLIIGFAGIWAWAWIHHRKEDFQKMSNIGSTAMTLFWTKGVGDDKKAG